MLAVFFWAGSGFPLAGAMNMFRWVVLGLGAFLAIGYYARRETGFPSIISIFWDCLPWWLHLRPRIVSVNPLMTFSRL